MTKGEQTGLAPFLGRQHQLQRISSISFKSWEVACAFPLNLCVYASIVQHSPNYGCRRKVSDGDSPKHFL
jgi:hypothetical protein